MPTDIVVRKGLNLKLKGEAVLETEDPKNSSDYSIYPSDFHGIYPKLVVKEKDLVRAGDMIFYDKEAILTPGPHDRLSHDRLSHDRLSYDRLS